jgi:predicted metal-binding membrane protein
MTSAPLELVYRHDRWFLAAGLLFVITLAWVCLFAGAGMTMTGIEMTRMSVGATAMMDMQMMRWAEWSPGYTAVMFCMWWIMMVAMMLPGAAPVILLAAALNRKADPGRRPYGSTAEFTLGYLLGWGAFSAAAVMAQWGLAESGLLSDMLVLKSRTLAAWILIAGGLWQFTPLKQACLHHCRSPIHFLTAPRRGGRFGAAVIGLRHSLYCIGCCWFLMLLLFVGGVMNLFWIAGLTIYVWLEKGLATSRWVSQAAGAGLLLAGLLLLI